MIFTSYNNWVNEQKKYDINFIDPELDYSELFRLLNIFNDILPDNIDKTLFDKNKYYAELISSEENESLQQKFNIDNGLEIKNKIDKKWHPFIDYIFNIFKQGKKLKINLNSLNNVYFGEDYKENQQSFHNFIRNPNYLKYVKDNDVELYNNYYKDSFDWFNKNTDKIAIPVIIKIKNKYFLVGGNRRLCWLLSKGIKSIPIWLINSDNNSMITDIDMFFIYENRISKYRRSKKLLSRSRKFDDEMKEKIKKYISSNTTYRNGHFRGLRKPKIEGKSFDGVGFGADKNGFYVYTHRARSKSKPLPEKITQKELKYIKSTG